MNRDLVLIAERRAGLASLLGCLLLEEPGPRVADLVRDIPSLAALGGGDPSVAVEYERVFLRGVALYESGFRSDDGQHGGSALAAVVDRYAEIGFEEHLTGGWRVSGADHLGLELRCYAQLCGDEARAWQDQASDLAMKTVEAERSFLADHLCAWAEVALEAAARVAGSGVYGTLIEAAGQFLCEEYDRVRPAPDVGEPFAVAPLPERMGPARLARVLLAPATCGGWLSTEDIAEAAAALGAPWRSSDTRSALRHVIEAALDSGDLGTLALALRPAVERLRVGHETRSGIDTGNAAHWRAWAARAAGMVALLDRIAQTGALGSERVTATETLTIRGDDAARLADAIDRAVAELRAAGLDVERTSGG